MKTLKSPWLQLLLSAVLIAGIWYVRQGGSPSLFEETLPDESLETGGAVSSHPALATPSPPNYDWSQIETEDYKEYASNLRVAGFPEELIREIIIADINALYAPLEEPLKFPPPAPDAPFSERHGRFSEEEWQRLFRLREVQMEKQAVLKEILGIYLPRELLRGPRSRNYEAYEYALGLLPQEKRDAVQFIVENEIITDALNHENYPDRAEELEAYRRTTEERNAALMQILTPEEFELYHMNTTPAGTELARQIIGMEPAGEEFRIMFGHAYEAWIEAGGVYGRWRAMGVPREQISAAEAKMQDNFRNALGEERYLDYQMAISTTGQQLRNFAARYYLPAETLASVFQLQREADQVESRIRAAQRGQAQADLTQLQARLFELNQQTEQVLGSDLWQTWNVSKGLRPSLEP